MGVPVELIMALVGLSIVVLITGFCGGYFKEHSGGVHRRNVSEEYG